MQGWTQRAGRTAARQAAMVPTPGRALNARERLAADPARGLEALRGHRVGAVVPGALRHQDGSGTRDLSQEITAAIAHGLRAQVTGRVIGDGTFGRAAEIRVEPWLLADRPEELARVHGGRRHARGHRAVGGSHERRVFAAQHHRARGIDREHLGARVDEGREDGQVAGGRGLHGGQIALLPGRHAATAQPGRAADVDPVSLEHDHGVPGSGLVVLD